MYFLLIVVILTDVNCRSLNTGYSLEPLPNPYLVWLAWISSESQSYL